MKSHGEIQDTLYDFVMNDLGAEEMDAMRVHLLTCGECRAAVEEIEQLVAAVPRPQEHPSDRLDQAHWAELTARIEQRLPAGGAVRHTRALTLQERLRAFLLPPRPAFALALAAVAIAATATLVLRPWEDGQPLPEFVETQTGPLEGYRTADADIAAHLRRSKNLLVGLTNESDPDALTDLSVEREASRRLLEDNRRYRSQVLDPQSSEVLADLEKIMLEVANSREQAPASDLDLIRQGIRQQNLLFKIRMAEQFSSRGMIVRASGEMMREE